MTDTDINDQQPQSVPSTSYISDLKSTIEFDRKCRAVESLLTNLKQRVDTIANSFPK